MNIIEHTMLGIDRILNGSPASADTANKSLSHGQKDVPHAGLGSVEAGIHIAQYRQEIYAYERLIESLYDLARANRYDELHDMVRAKYLAIHGEPR